ncbi:Ankyrin repeat-containing domain [Pseudocohnilembus persalinus]|uniref:Ankyrin repeat-containing domain n=1 Tax=Pseudocohnilembus persalinus TaxID=266149 RepID=A0A0V0R8B2_PSEPJ|nr:Ankyrin repeat-containing domain [Pseudocohnilembus persalinus]|eukprot:KRX10608.1 Ankyrin repeat-containing domain [Pseudocohnilembus persalinus]
MITTNVKQNNLAEIHPQKIDNKNTIHYINPKFKHHIQKQQKLNQIQKQKIKSHSLSNLNQKTFQNNIDLKIDNKEDQQNLTQSLKYQDNTNLYTKNNFRNLLEIDDTIFSNLETKKQIEEKFKQLQQSHEQEISQNVKNSKTQIHNKKAYLLFDKSLQRNSIRNILVSPSQLENQQQQQNNKKNSIQINFQLNQNKNKNQNQNSYKNKINFHSHKNSFADLQIQNNQSKTANSNINSLQKSQNYIQKSNLFTNNNINNNVINNINNKAASKKYFNSTLQNISNFQNDEKQTYPKNQNLNSTQNFSSSKALTKGQRQILIKQLSNSCQKTQKNALISQKINTINQENSKKMLFSNNSNLNFSNNNNLNNVKQKKQVEQKFENNNKKITFGNNQNQDQMLNSNQIQSQIQNQNQNQNQNKNQIQNQNQMLNSISNNNSQKNATSNALLDNSKYRKVKSPNSHQINMEKLIEIVEKKKHSVSLGNFFEIKLNSSENFQQQQKQQQNNLNLENNQTKIENQSDFISFLSEMANSPALFKPSVFIMNNTYLKKICEEFEIDLKKLSDLQEIEDRENYLSECLQLSLQKSLKQLQEKNNKKAVNEYNQQLQEQKNQKKQQEKEQDLFFWLKIKTKFIYLKKKLRADIINELNSPENLQKAQNFISSQKNQQIQIEVYDSQSNQQQQNQNQNFNMIIVDSPKRKSKSSYQFNSQLEILNSQQQQMNSSKLKILLRQNSNCEKNQNETEKIKKLRQEAINEYQQDFKSKVFQEIGLQPVLNETYVPDNDTKKREILLYQRENERKIFNQKELEFLARTSILLNKFQDKEMIQNTVNFLDPEILHQIEIQLADKVINKFLKLKNVLKTSRQLYLQEQVEIGLKKNRDWEKKQTKKQEIQQKLIKSNETQKKNIYQFQRLYKKVINMVQNLEKKEFQKQNLKTLKKLHSKTSINSNFFQQQNTQLYEQTPKTNRSANSSLQEEDFYKSIFGKHSQQQIKSQLSQRQSSDQKQLQKQQQQKQLQQEEEYTIEQLLEIQQKKIEEKERKQQEIIQQQIQLMQEQKQQFALKKQENISQQANKKPFLPINKEKKQFLSLEQIKRTFHPPSKLIIGINKIDEFLKIEDQLNEDEQKQLKQLKLQQERQRDFQLPLNNQAYPEENPEKQKYIQFYSSGPQEVREYKAIEYNDFKPIRQEVILKRRKEPWITKDLEIQACIIIQKMARGYIARRKLKKIKKYYQKRFKQKPNQLQESHKILHYVAKSLNAIQKNKNPANKNVIDLPINKQALDVNIMNKKQTFIFQKQPQIIKEKRLTYHSQFSSPRQFNIQHQTFNQQQMNLIQQQQSNQFDENQTQTQNFSQKSPKIQLNSPTSQNHSSSEFNYQSNFYLAKSSSNNLKPIDINTKDEKGNVPLYYVTKNPQKEFINLLLHLKGNMNIRCTEGMAPVHFVFKSNDLDLILTAINNGASLNILNNKGQTPLAFANQQTLTYLGLNSGIAQIDEGTLIQIQKEYQQSQDEDLFILPFGDNDKLWKQNPENRFNLEKLDPQEQQQNFRMTYINDTKTEIRENEEIINKNKASHNKNKHNSNSIPRLKSFMEKNERIEIEEKKKLKLKQMQIKQKNQEQLQYL